MSETTREQLALDLLGGRYEQLTPIQRSVIDLIASETPSAADPEMKVDERSAGQRIADRVAAIGGSWGFIGGFALCLGLWMAWNAWGEPRQLAFDPYPFIFLNLVLSTLAAVQAPIIMMSQNRAAERDRRAAEQDYIVNLRAELEIMHLHDKLDAIRHRELIEVIKRQNETLRILRGAHGRPDRDG